MGSAKGSGAELAVRIGECRFIKSALSSRSLNLPGLHFTSIRTDCHCTRTSDRFPQAGVHVGNACGAGIAAFDPKGSATNFGPG
jgi:hypothetical protein